MPAENSQPSTPDARLTALESSVQQLQSAGEQTRSEIQSLNSSMTTALDGIKAIGEQLKGLTAQQPSTPAPEQSAPAPAPAPKAEAPAPVPQAPAAALTAEQLGQAVAQAMSGALTDITGKIAAIEGKLTADAQAREEVNKTKLPHVEGDGQPITGSAAAGGDPVSATPKVKTYDEVFAEDREVNPAGWETLAHAPRDQVGMQAITAMETKYGTREQYNRSKGLPFEQSTTKFQPRLHVMQIKQAG